ncbi:ABC-2 type transport system ATP-binding protein [Olsenella profusa DSM 13989]|uniref:ABC transporter ATP-binding protein n=1 Tax=Olsenella profusa TaxID=138595 RepID=UPI002782CBFF|nr:ABC transporter ATP-binding protein [Olsenella profusa]MDP9859983.1 ABC-2 type transport system ATP-binding protein [Olsenella profusa DSM 13989]
MTRSGIVTARGLTKDYGQGRGIFDVSFAVEEGEVLGFLGSNGAGKTVTMRHLMGFVRPQAGVTRIFGLDCFAERAAIQGRLGYLPGETAVPEDMTGIAFLEYMARLRRLRDHTRMHELIERFELDPKARVRRMSKGTRQKVGLVCAFMGRPDVLLLDEPTSGFDPLMQGRFVELVRQERDRGATVFLSSHIFEEVERTCDRVAFIRAGRLVSTERMGDVRASRRHAFRVTFPSADERARYQRACTLRGVKVHALSEHDVEVWAGADVDAFVKELAGFRVEGLASREQTLEEMFLHFYGKDATGEGDVG